jgi:hypothetical protein
MLPTATATDIAHSVKTVASVATVADAVLAMHRLSVRRVSFPEGKLEFVVGNLRWHLVRIYRNLCGGSYDAAAARWAGDAVIEQIFAELGLELQTYLERKHVAFSFEFETMQITRKQAQTCWNQIIEDITTKTSTPTSQIGVCSCQEHHLLRATSAPYWLTPAGLMRRILGLSQDFVYRALNLGLHLAAIQNNVYGLQWVMHQDDRLCPVCLGHGTGGDHGFYRLTGFKPDPPPVHPGCRCTYQLIIKK